MELAEITLPNRHHRHEQPSGSLNVVAIRHGLLGCIHAKETVESLTFAAGFQMRVESCMWSFDMLTRLDLRHASLAKGREADVLIVAAEAAAPMPAYVKSWITTCLRENRQGAPVLVAIYDEDFEGGGSLPPLRSDLVTIAAQWRTPLLCNREFDARLERDSITELFGRGPKPTPSRFDLHSLLAMPSAGRWGINE